MTPYEIWSLIIGAVGAIATFSAVVVALWQTKYANRKRLKCCFIENNTVCSANFNQLKSYVGMDITNIGNKKVIVNSWGIKTQNKFLLILTDIKKWIIQTTLIKHCLLKPHTFWILNKI